MTVIIVLLLWLIGLLIIPYTNVYFGGLLVVVLGLIYVEAKAHAQMT